MPPHQSYGHLPHSRPRVYVQFALLSLLRSDAQFFEAPGDSWYRGESTISTTRAVHNAPLMVSQPTSPFFKLVLSTKHFALAERAADTPQSYAWCRAHGDSQRDPTL